MTTFARESVAGKRYEFGADVNFLVLCVWHSLFWTGGLDPNFARDSEGKKFAQASGAKR